MFDPRLLAGPYDVQIIRGTQSMFLEYYRNTQTFSLGYAAKEGSNRYKIVLFTPANAHPVFDLGLISHEIAHVRYGSLECEKDFRRHINGWGPLGGVWKGIWNYLEDARVEYQMLLDFPHALPYIASLRTLMREIVTPQSPETFQSPENLKLDIPSQRTPPTVTPTRANFIQELMDVTRGFVRLGEYPAGWRAEADFLAPRLTVVARSKNPLDTMRLASEYLAYTLLRRNQHMPKMPVVVRHVVDSKKADALEDAVEELAHRERRKKGKTERTTEPSKRERSTDQKKHTQRILESLEGSEKDSTRGYKLTPKTPWGAVSGKWKDILRALITQLDSGGVSITEIMEVLDIAIASNAFVERIVQERKDDIAAVTEALKRIESRKTYYAMDGSIAIEKQQEAYAQSFIGPDDQGKVYERKRRVPAVYDAVVVIDVSGSMSIHQLTESAMSDVIVLVKAMQESKTRFAVFGVDHYLHIFKRFEDTLNEARLNPKGTGGTNFHHFFTKLPEVAQWAHNRRMIFIVSDGDWYWGVKDFTEVRAMPFYHGVEWYVVFLRDHWKTNPQAESAVQNVFRMVYPDLPSAVLAATGTNIKESLT